MASMLRKLTLLSTFLVLTIAFQNCGYIGPSDPSAYEFSSEAAADFATLKTTIFSSRCLSCHSGVSSAGGYDLSNYVSAMELVVPGSLSASVLAQRLSDMPPSLPLSANEKRIVQDWILAGAPGDSAGPVPTPTPPGPTPTPAPSFTPAPATFSWLSANVFQPRCISCHGATNADGGYRFNTYANAVSRGITVGNGTNSRVYIAVRNDAMPVSGTKLTPQQKDALKRWIDSGALNN